MSGDPMQRWKTVMARMEAEAKECLLGRSERKRMLRDMERMFREALAKGMAPEDVGCLLTSDRQGSVRIYVGDHLSLAEFMEPRPEVVH